MAALTRQMRAVIDSSQSPTGCSEFIRHVVVYLRKSRLAQEPPPDSRLISDNENFVARARKPRDRLETSGKGDPFINRFDEVG